MFYLIECDTNDEAIEWAKKIAETGPWKSDRSGRGDGLRLGGTGSAPAPTEEGWQ